MKTELLQNLEMTTYRAMHGLSKHSLDSFAVCPSYHKWKESQEWKPSREMELGTLVHSLALEGRCEYAIAPACDRRTKEGKLTWENFCQENIGKVILNEDEGSRVEGACAAVEPLLQMVTAAKIIEASLFWERDGVQCKGRPDMITEIKGRPAIVDLKTTSDWSKFDHKFFGFGYDKQAAWYTYGLEKITGQEDIDFYFLVVDMQAPHLSQWVKASTELIDIANDQLDVTLAQYKLCLDQDVWPGPPTMRVMLPRRWEEA